MSHVVHPRKKFRFDARVEYVTEELDHNGSLFFMFNIKVVADPEGIDHGMDSIQWSVIKSEDEFHQTHKSLKTKYGLLKSFQFRNPSAIGNNMFHLTHPTKPRREKKDEFLLAVLSLDPIPDEVSAFLCLDNAFYFAKTTTEENQHRSSIHSSALSIDTSHNTINKRNHGNAVTTVGSPVGAFSPQRAERVSSSKRWYLDAGLIVSFIVLALGAALLSQLASSVGNATGISHKDSIVMLLYAAIGQFVHAQLLMWKARMEVVVVMALVYLYAHRVIGWGLGLYLRNKLDPQSSGKFAFHFEWISFRCGLDQNMIVFSGVEWRNPPAFQHTPYLLRIDELSFVIDAPSVLKALSRTGAIKVKEIRFNKVVLHMEKLAPKLGDKRDKGVKVLTDNSESLVDQDTSIKSSTVTTAAADTTANTSNATTLKAGVLNLWACMGATDAAQEASMLSSVSGQMNSAVESGQSMVSVLGSAVSKYNPAAFLYKGGASIGATGANLVGGIGSAIGKGLFRGHHHHKHDKDKNGDTGTHPSEGVAYGDAEVELEVDPHAMERALHDTLHAIGESEGTDTGSDDEHEVPVRTSAENIHIPHLGNQQQQHHNNTNNTSPARTHSSTTTASATPESSTHPSPLPHDHNTHHTHHNDKKHDKHAKADKADKPSKKGFGLPYLLDIDNLQLDRLELHTQDFLNSTHSDVSYGVIKLKSLSMSHKDLSKPPKNDPTISAAENEFYRNKRRPLFLDDVVWRLVNKLLAELLKNNSIAMMVLLSSAAVNNATGVVSSAGSIAYSGAATGGRLFNKASNVVLGSTKSGGTAHSTDSTPARVRPTANNTVSAH